MPHKFLVGAHQKNLDEGLLNSGTSRVWKHLIERVQGVVHVK